MFGGVIERGLDKRRLRILLVVFFLALAIPTLILIFHAYTQLKWESFHRARVTAEELAGRIDSRLSELIEVEEARSFADYAFLEVAGDPDANFLQRSRLSSVPIESGIPGLLGYFQVDANGLFSTPLLPESSAIAGSYGISQGDYAARRALEQRIWSVLIANRLVPRRASDALSRSPAGMPAEERARSRSDQEGAGLAESEEMFSAAVAGSSLADEEVPQQAAFDQLSRDLGEAAQAQTEKKPPSNVLGRVADRKVDSLPEARRRGLDQGDRQSVERGAAAPSKRATRKEQSSLPEPLVKAKRDAVSVLTERTDIRIATFESEIDPFDFSLLDSGHFVLFRKVWRDGQRYIQGAIIEQPPFLDGLIASAYRDTALSMMSELVVAYQGDVLRALSGPSERDYSRSTRELDGKLLYHARLPAPLDRLELIFRVTQLPAGPGGTLLVWVTAILALVLLGGLVSLYRLGAGQIDLARKQQDFVSAVSHELKTPLTSIRMYGEMLKQGWASEEKKQTYYDYIYDESERLSRLITNVLQLARLTRNDPQFDLRPVKVSELMDMLQSKIASQIHRAGFTLEIERDARAANTEILVDTDCFAQIVINLIDNAIKFSAKADRKVIEITARVHAGGAVVFAVRDYGPGVPKDQMKRIVTLFYRLESELTRETVGTGIGLALVHQLAIAMDARVEVRNAEPGAEFKVSFAGKVAD